MVVEAVEDGRGGGAGAGVMRMRMMMVVARVLDPAGRRRRVGARPPDGHVGYVGRHLLLHACNQ